MHITGKVNALVIQSGGATPVMNRSLFGLVDEAETHRKFQEVYGAAHGVEGLLDSELVSLGTRSRSEWRRIARTPAAALGSTRRKIQTEDLPGIFEILSRFDVHFCFIIGGNDSAETGHTMSAASKAAGYDLAVINVPKTIDNDLAVTDHSPGYGSAARFVALATMGAGRDAEAMGKASPVTVIEVMGRDAGWLAASGALAKRDERDAPHVICVPEVPVDEDRFLENMEDAYRRFGFAVAVISENARGADGVIGVQGEPWYVDDFGHPYFDGPGRYLAGLVGGRLKIRARYEKPGTIQRSLVACVSALDAREAEMAGRAAVRYALEGHSDQMVTLVRGPGKRYECTTGLTPLETVAGQVKKMPREYLDPSSYHVTSKFLAYARPLMGGRLPHFGRLFARHPSKAGSRN